MKYCLNLLLSLFYFITQVYCQPVVDITRQLNIVTNNLNWTPSPNTATCQSQTTYGSKNAVSTVTNSLCSSLASNSQYYSYQMTQSFTLNDPHYKVAIKIIGYLYGQWHIQDSTCIFTDVLKIYIDDNLELVNNVKDLICTSGIPNNCQLPPNCLPMPGNPDQSFTMNFQVYHSQPSFKITIQQQSITDFSTTAFGISNLQLVVYLCDDPLCERCQYRRCISCKNNTYVDPNNYNCSTSCPSGYFLDDYNSPKKCVTACSPLAYVDYQQRRCIKCENNCVSCLNSTTCQLCATTFFLYYGKCVTICPTQTYIRTDVVECRNCQPTCLSCTGSSQCTLCDYNNVLIGGICYPCRDQLCQVCTNVGPKDCIRCIYPNLLKQGICITKQQCMDLAIGEVNDKARTCDPCLKGQSLNKETGKCQQCYYTCRNCNGFGFDDCTLCPSERSQLGDVYPPQFGMCNCYEKNEYDYLNTQCEVIVNMSFGLPLMMAFIVLLAIILCIMQQSRIILLILIDHCQLWSILLYINVPFSLFLDEFFKVFNYFHINNLFPNPLSFQINQLKNQTDLIFTENSFRAGETLFSQLSETKFLLNGKSASFVQNFFVLFMMTIIPWAFIGIIKLIQYKYATTPGGPITTNTNLPKQPSQSTIQNQRMSQRKLAAMKMATFKQFIEKIFEYTLIHEVYLRTFMELFLIIILQFSNGNQSNDFNRFSLAMSIFFFFYIIGMFTRLVYVINYQYQDEELRRKYNAVVYELDTNDIVKKNYNFLILFRKFFYVIIVFFLYGKPFAVLILMLLMSLLFIVLLIIIAPYQKKEFNMLLCLMEVFNVIIYGVLIGFVNNYKDDRPSGQNYAIAAIFFIFTSLFTYFLYMVLQLKKFFIDEEENKSTTQNKAITTFEYIQKYFNNFFGVTQEPKIHGSRNIKSRQSNLNTQQPLNMISDTGYNEINHPEHILELSDMKQTRQQNNNLRDARLNIMMRHDESQENSFQIPQLNTGQDKQ